jgi:hypothetical protein
MSAGAAGGAVGAAGAAQAAIIQAVKASGVIVRVEPGEFGKVLAMAEAPLVVTAPGGWLGRKFAYLTSYKGLAFHCVSAAPLPLPERVEVVAANKIWVPG